MANNGKPPRVSAARENGSCRRHHHRKKRRLRYGNMEAASLGKSKCNQPTSHDGRLLFPFLHSTRSCILHLASCVCIRSHRTAPVPVHTHETNSGDVKLAITITDSCVLCCAVLYCTCHCCVCNCCFCGCSYCKCRCSGVL